MPLRSTITRVWDGNVLLLFTPWGEFTLAAIQSQEIATLSYCSITVMLTVLMLGVGSCLQSFWMWTRGWNTQIYDNVLQVKTTKSKLDNTQPVENIKNFQNSNLLNVSMLLCTWNKQCLIESEVGVVLFTQNDYSIPIRVDVLTGSGSHLVPF